VAKVAVSKSVRVLYFQCVIDKIASNYKVRSGSSRKSRGGVLTNAEKIVPHPSFDSSTLNYDFMLLKLIQPLVYSERQQPIKIATESSRAYFASKEVLTCGFGLTQDDLQSNEFLRGVIVTFSGKEACSKAYPDMITEQMVCAGSDKNMDSCQGDSGDYFNIHDDISLSFIKLAY
jgi:trypsin